MMLLLAVGCLLLVGTNAHPSGAPDEQCAGMAPTGHGGNTAGSTPSPYSVVLSTTQYAAGGSIIVTLTGPQSFKGFFIQARSADTTDVTPIGTFQVIDTTQAPLVQTGCSGKALTHTSALRSTPTDKLELKWNAPNTLAGNIIFYVTFVEERTKYWVKESSAPVWDGQSAKPTTSAPGEVTDPPALSTPISQDGCGSTKSCYGDCNGNTCDFLLTWKRDGTKVFFELFGSLADGQGYVALGLSKQDKMSDVSIIACTADSNRNSAVQQYYASGRVSPVYQDTGPISGDAVSAAIQTSTEPNTMSCRFTYDNGVGKSNSDKWKDLDEELYLFVARGGFFGPNSLAKHTATPKISPGTQKLTSDQYVSVTGSKPPFLIKAHACIMVLAWVFCASVGLMLARYYKPMWTDTKACGQKVWFSYHRALMLTAMFLTVIGFVIILVHQGGLFVTPEKLPTKAHPILGLISIICALLNPLIAAFRCGPSDAKRPIFNWIHWFFGTVAHVFAIVAIFLGMLIPSVLLPGWITYVMMAFCLFHVCVEFILEIHQCCMYDKNRDRQEEYSMANKDGKAAEPQYAGRGFKCAMLVIYMIGVTVITIALVVIIAIWGSAVGTTGTTA